MKKRIIGILCAMLVGCVGTAALAGCGGAGEPTTTTSTAEQNNSAVVSQEESQSESSFLPTTSDTAVSAVITEVGDQLDKPAIGEEIAVIETTQGTIKMRLFPEQAPKAVANFKQLAQDGIYNDMLFHRVIDGFMIQTGESASTSIYGDWFEDEFSDKLLNLRGAVSMANISQPDTNSTQFFINQTPAESFIGWDYYVEGYRYYMQQGDLFTQSYGSWADMSKVGMDVRTLYEQNGGNPTLDGAYTTTGLGHTVFGQVFEGLDVVDKIAKAETDGNDRPTDEAAYRIKSITFEKYEG